MPLPAFSARLLDWFDRHGRRDLPWQHPREPYRVWLSEIMLQQTQVATVLPYFQRFVARFPDLRSLAGAPLDEVLQLWAGLGYYARARNLHRTAQTVVREHGGEFPRDFAALCALPGIGRSTAGAIAAQAYGARHAILDGNLRRLLARHAAVEGWPGSPAVQTRLWDIATRRLPQARLADYTQAGMDLGSLVCTARNPDCASCPVRQDCLAFRQGRVAQLPHARPRRERPLRKRWLFLIESEAGEILLERRPPVGIWGGLWCPPMADVALDRALELQRLGLEAVSGIELPALRHGFTHFELELKPLRIRARTASALHESAEQRWIRMDHEPREIPALPAPIRKLLLAHFNSSPCPEPSTA